MKWSSISHPAAKSSRAVSNSASSLLKLVLVVMEALSEVGKYTASIPHLEQVRN
jgi:hypothetical protein